MKTPVNTLYVIDDDPKSRKAVAALASSLKIQCETFASAEAFLDCYDPSWRGCVLVDFRLGGMNGLQFVDRLRAKESALAVVLVSAYVDVPMTVLAMQNGVQTVLEKPYRTDNLADAIRKAMDSGNRMRRPPAEPADDRYFQRAIVNDLHDGVAQFLTMALMHLDHYRQQGIEAKMQEPGNALLQKVQELLKRSIDELRSLIRGTHVATETENLVGALQELIAEFQDRLKIDLVHDLQSAHLGTLLTSAVYRIVQESLTNAWRHSQSQRVQINLRQEDGHLCVNVRDWGIGFDDEKIEQGHYGLKGIRGRAGLLGGEAAITSALGEGTCVSVRFPHVAPALHESTPRLCKRPRS